MKKRISSDMKTGQTGAAILCVLTLVACGGALDSVEGPKTGAVSGFVCNDLPILSAGTEVPAIQPTLIKDGKCLHLRTRAQVNFERTVMMPGDGQYSQFEYEGQGAVRKLWVRTSDVR